MIDWSCPKCGQHVPMRLHEFPLHCACGYVAERGNGKPWRDKRILASPCKKRVTLGVTAFKRPESLQRLLDSIKTHYGDLPLLVEDTDGNLSGGRNRLVEKCSTEYLAILEDDFELTERSDLSALVRILDYDPDVAVATGRLLVDGRPTDYACDLRRFRDTLEVIEPPAAPWLWTDHGQRYRYCDLTFNFFVARTEFLREHPWDEELEICEHAPWFLAIADEHAWRIAFTPQAEAVHHKDGRSDEYTSWRTRTYEFQPIVAAKYGFARQYHIWRMRPDRERPNAVLLGVGHSNTTITTRQLEALGWNLGDADQEFAESIAVRSVNEELLATGRFNRPAAESALAALPQPWAVKDPRFVQTLSRWTPVLAYYEPLLLHVVKNPVALLDSYRHRGAEDVDVEARQADARRQADIWPWAKITLAAEAIGAAAGLFTSRR